MGDGADQGQDQGQGDGLREGDGVEVSREGAGVISLLFGMWGGPQLAWGLKSLGLFYDKDETVFAIV